MASDQVDLIADGREALNRTVYSLEEFSHVYKYMVVGQYTPLDCTAIQKVAIIVSYRDREKQLRIFMNNVIPRIYRQQLEFGIYIIEQVRKQNCIGLSLIAISKCMYAA